jgi:CRISPR/Cas system-associated exonuclease Cas4 (RecB family)
MENQRGRELANAIIAHFNDIHRKDLPVDFGIERSILQDEISALNGEKARFEKVMTFTPSSASKCERELYYKASRFVKDESLLLPYQRRWTRNGSAVHRAVQKDLLYAEKYLEVPRFTVLRTKTGKPAWERNIALIKQFEHNGIRFQVYGMMDAVLLYMLDNSKIGFEFKTKSTTIGAVGTYKMKDAADYHKEQCIGYSLLFGLNEFLLVYESLAKDSWMKGEEAKEDIRAFYYEVTEDDRGKMLDKFAGVATKFYNREVPEFDPNKCLFCSYKEKCEIDKVAS